jgi:hypothetical protein
MKAHEAIEKQTSLGLSGMGFAEKGISQMEGQSWLLAHTNTNK